MRLLLPLVLAACLLATSLGGAAAEAAGGSAAATGTPAEPVVEPRELPRRPALEPREALASFKVRGGFRIELVAAEPLVVDPVAITFDELGTAYVVEMRDYSERREERLGRVRRLTDVDGDGRFDRSTVFAEGLPWPTAIIAYAGGVYVGASPDILFFKDADGDGIAEHREVVFTGFGATVDRLNVQRLLNNFTWGLDNRIHGANGGNGGRITCIRFPERPSVELRGQDFSFDPRTLEFRTESGGGQHGLSFDDLGHKFVCSNSQHLQMIIYDARDRGSRSIFPMPDPLVDIAEDGGAAPVFRLSPDEPWRVIRTGWRVAGLVPGPVEGGGRPSGYFTGATGLIVYRGDGWPDAYRGDVFVADCGSNLVHRKMLIPDGVGFIGRRPADEQGVEFLASTDNAFRPVQLANGPDGMLYILDMYREVIEHPWSIPESIKRLLDLNSGNDRGRIYRVVPTGSTRMSARPLADTGTRELVRLLGHRNGWHRDAASRLLYERQDPASRAMLEELFKMSNSPLARIGALWALHGQRALSAELLTRALGDPDSGAREHAIRLFEEIGLRAGSGERDFWAMTGARLAHDTAPRVRFQLALTLGPAASAETKRMLVEMIQQDPAEKWLRAAVLTTLTEDAAPVFVELARSNEFRGKPGSQEFLEGLVSMVGAGTKSGGLRSVAEAVAKFPDAAPFRWLSVLGASLQGAGKKFPDADVEDVLHAVFARAGVVAGDESRPVEMRVEAIDCLAHASYSATGQALTRLLQPGRPSAVQEAAARTLARFPDAAASNQLIKNWEILTPRLRHIVLDGLLRRGDSARQVVDGIEAGRLARADLSASQVEFLRRHRDSELQARSRRLLEVQAERTQVIEHYWPALKLAGNAAHGKAMFAERCAACHRVAGLGHAVGPDLATVKRSGKPTILVHILDPNRVVAPEFLSYRLETRQGDEWVGLIVSETKDSVTLRSVGIVDSQTGGGFEQVILRERIRELRALGVSAMPEGLEAGLNAQDLADLLEFIVAAE